MALTLEQRKARRLGIGGSDIAAIFGISEWASPLDIYLEKLSTEEPYEVEESGLGFNPKEWGNNLEPVIIAHFEKVTGFKCETGFQNAFLHPKYPFMRANIDAKLIDRNEVLECKTASQFKGKEWSPLGGDNIPEPYLLQCAYYAEILDLDKVHVAVLIGGNDFRLYHYDRNPALGQIIMDKVIHFWNNHVLKQIPPEPISLEDATKLWRNIVSENVKVADSKVENLVNELRKLKAHKKALEEQCETLQTQLCSFVQDAQQVNNEYGDALLTWKLQTFNRFDTKAFKNEYPDLYNTYIKSSQTRILKLKGESYG